MRKQTVILTVVAVFCLTMMLGACGITTTVSKLQSVSVDAQNAKTVYFTGEEFTAEGKINRNCVASYFGRASEGKANIFVIRKKTEPDAPYVTVELSTNFDNIRQCYAKGNTIPPESVIEFSEKWLKEVVMKRKKGKAA